MSATVDLIDVHEILLAMAEGMDDRAALEAEQGRDRVAELLRAAADQIRGGEMTETPTAEPEQPAEEQPSEEGEASDEPSEESEQEEAS